MEEGFKMKGKSKLSKIFGKKRIIALAGNKHTGKTNNLIHLIEDFRKYNKTTEIYSYGLPGSVQKYLKLNYKVQEISSLTHLVKKKDCIIIVDEFQKLKLNDRRYKDTLDMFIDFIYHNNVYCILSSPNIREFNSIIGSIIERWLLKDVSLDSCVRGSQLRKIVDTYKGRYKTLGDISIEKGELLLINDEKEIIIKCPYVKEADSKKDNIDIWSIEKEVKK